MKQESSITYITGYSGIISHKLFIIAWGADTHTHIRTEVIFKNQAHACSWFVPGLKTTPLATIHLFTRQNYLHFINNH